MESIYSSNNRKYNIYQVADSSDVRFRELIRLIDSEEERQEEEISLIASENYAPKSIRDLVSSCLTNKYAEGYPGKRYYAGCAIIDQIEQLALESGRELFGAEHANVQPHSGSQANMAAYAALLNPGDVLMGMSLTAGGHLTHGHGVNFSGLYYKSVQYGVDRETELIDYDDLEKRAYEYKPKLIIAGASAYSRTINFERIYTIAQSVGAYFVADIAHIAGLVATGLHPSPVPYADMVTSTTHKTLRGPRGGFLLTKSHYREQIDRAVLPGMQGGPLMHVIAAKAQAFLLAQWPEFKEYQQRVITNAQIMASLFAQLGYRIVSGGTDNHLFVLDLSMSQNIASKCTGLVAERLLERAGIAVSRSCLPFDTQKPWITSGIRIGTPAVTTRGMSAKEMELLVELIDHVLTRQDDTTIKSVKEKVRAIARDFSLKNF